MLTLLPLGSFIVGFFSLYGRQLRRGNGHDWKHAFLQALIVWGLIAAISLELLSTFDGITQLSLAILWGAVLVSTAGAGSRAQDLQRGWGAFRSLLMEMDRASRVIAAGCAALLGGLFLVAWISPPNNVDSSLYHLARVMHWAQHGSLANYAAKYHHQLNRPPFAEMAIMHLRVLFGSDRPAALVQWFSLGAGLIAVARIGAQLEVGRWGRWLAVAFVLGMPMSMLQGSSTQNDLVVGLWYVVSLSLLLDYVRRPGKGTAAWLGAAVGLALLTKATGYLYSVGLVPALVVLRARKGAKEIGQSLAHAGIMLLLVVLLNLGFWARNTATYGSPLGGIRDLETHLSVPDGPSDSPAAAASSGRLRSRAAMVNTRSITGMMESARLTNVTGPDLESEIGIWLLADRASRQSEPVGAFEWVIGRLRKGFSDLMMHYVLPSSALDGIALGIQQRLGFALDDSFFDHRQLVAWNHEDTAGNPIHLTLIGLSLLVVALGRKERPQSFRVYGSALLLGFTAILGFGDHSSRWALRYHLPFFLAAAPLVALAGEMWLSGRVIRLLAVGCLAIGLPWLLLNNTRPLIGMQPWPTRVDSVLVEDPARLMFATAPELQDEAEATAAAIQASQCTRVGLWLESKEPEYPIWWLLDAPQSGIHLTNVHTYDSLETYLDTDFNPCLVLCTLCADDDSVLGLPLMLDYGHYRLYGDPSMTPPSSD